MKGSKSALDELASEIQKLRQRNAEYEARASASRTRTRRIEELSSLREDLLRSGTLQEKLKRITDGLVDIFDADFARIWITRPGNRCDSGCVHANVTEGPHVCLLRDRCLHLLASSGRYTHIDGEVHQRVPFGSYKIGRVAAGLEAKFLTNNVAHDPRIHHQEWARTLGLVSFAGFRLLSADGKAIGVLALFSKRELSEDDAVLIEGVANTAAQTLQTSTVEEALRFSEQMLKSILSASPIGIVLTREREIKWVNDAWLKMFGFEDEHECLGQSARILYPSDEEFERVGATLLNRLETGSVTETDARFRRKDGDVFEGNVRLKALDPSDTTKGAIAVITDITERRKSEEALRQSEERYRTLYDYNPSMYFTLGADGTVLSVNRFGAAELGYSVEELVGKSVLMVFHEDDREPVRQQLAKCLQNPVQVAHWEFRKIRKDGSILGVEEVARAIRGADGNPVVLVVCQNVTERRRAEESLRVERERFEMISERAPFGLVMIGKDGTFEYVNRKFTEIFGYDLSDVPNGRVFYQKAYPDRTYRNQIKSAWREDLEVLPPREPASRIFEATCEDGSTKIINFRTAKLGSGQYLMTCEDITERIRAEQALQDSEEKLKAVVYGCPMPQLVIDRDHRVIYWNKALEELTGFRAEEMIGTKQHWKAFYREERPCMVDLLVDGELEQIRKWYGSKYSKSALISDAYHGTDFFPMGSREGKWLRFTAALIRDSAGNVVGAMETTEDITVAKQAEEALREAHAELERRVAERTAELAAANDFLKAEIAEREQAEAALWDSEARLRSLMAVIPDPLVVYDPQGHVTYVNAAFVETYGWSQEELLGKHIDFVPPEEMERTREAWERSMQRDKFLFETKRFTKDRRLLDIELTSAGVLFDEEGGHRATIVIHRDVTKRKRAEEALQKAYAELVSFSYSVSHDLRAPLRGIDGWSLALLEDCAHLLDEKGRKYLEYVRTEAQRMGMLIDDLLGLSRVTCVDMIRESIDLSALARSIAGRLQDAEPTRQAEFTIQPGLMTHGDGRLLEAMLSNLLGNAWKFTCKHPSARIEFGRTEVDGRKAYFVRDDGAGFDMAYARKLFGAFQRMHQTSEFPGSGIGLATVQRIVHRHGGRVWAEAEVEKGATFYFTLQEDL